jgi:hypothetical protein
MRSNYVLIDYENVQPQSLAGLHADHFKVLLFMGANQSKVPFEVADAMQRLGERAQYVKISGNGPNALDFHIAFYIGHLASTDGVAYFHVISKDAGFDPLIQHLKTKKISVSRSRCIEDIPLLKIANVKSLPEKIDLIVANLRSRGSAKPRTLKTLSSTIQSLFQKQLAEPELAELLSELQRRALVTVSENKVSYALPDSET